MSSIPYVKFYPSDWRGGVSLLTDFQELLYFKICLHNWDTGQPIAEEVIPRLFRDPCAGIADALLTLIARGKIEHDIVDGYYNPRAVSVHFEAQERREQAQGAAATRWKHKNKLKDAPAMRQQANSICQPEPEPEPEPKENTIDQFENFWTQYPRKIGKAKAKQAYLKAVQKSSHADLMAGAMTLSAIAQDVKFIPHATTWLNGERWNDEPTDINPTANRQGNGQGHSSITAVIRDLQSDREGR